MAYIKAALATITTLLIALLVYTVVSFNPEEELNKALELYLEGNIPAAEDAIARLESSLAPMHYHLYMGYLERAASNMEQSTKELQLAEKDAVDRANFNLLLEIVLNQAYNAYITHDKEALAEAVKRAAKFGGPNQDWVLLFRGLIEYDDGDYAKALSMWKQDSARPPLSPWMKKDFESTFTKYWYTVRFARSNIEEGKISAARQALEGQIPLLSGEQLEDVLFLMGYSYAKEAADKGPVEAVPYYKLAVSYFNKIPFLTDKYAKERELLIRQVNGQAQSILQVSDYKDIPYYLTLLDTWKARADLDDIKALLIEQFNKSIALGSVKQSEEIYAVLRLMIPEGTERQGLEASLQEVIGKKNLESLDQYARQSVFLSDQADEKPLVVPDAVAQEINDPFADLILIRKLLDKAISDRKINANFRIDRSTDLQKALRQMNEFVEEHKDLPQAYTMLGQIRYLLGDYEGSAKAYEEAIALDPRNPMTYRYMALVYEAVNQSQDATLLLLQALKYAPKNADIWEQLAGLYLKTGNELDALPSYKEAIRIDPDRYELYLALGRLQVKLEMPEDAGQNLQKYLVHYPDDKEALKLMLMSLYNPLLNVDPIDTTTLDKQRDDIYQRLYAIAPEDAERIRKGYRPPPPVVSPPPKPEPNLPFLPQ